MENQEKSPERNRNQGGEGSAHKHHRRHRGHHGNGQRSEAHQQNAAAAEKKPSAKQQSANDGKRKQEGNHHGNDRRKNQGNRRSDGKNRRPNPNLGPENLYGNPTENDVLTMEELRARIVLKAADGSVPVAEAPASAAETVAPAEIADPLSDPFEDSDSSLTPMPEDPAAADASAERVEVVGIRFRSSSKVYYFDPKGIALKQGQNAVVETARGPEFGEVTFGNRMVRKACTVSPLRPVLRAATEQDIRHNEENIRKEQQAMVIGRKKIEEHGLEMKLPDVQYAFDNSKLLFYFSAEDRVDFRALVKDLAAQFRTRIELRQIQARDEAKMLGGLGSCGRPLCCTGFLPNFAQVSIKMAKDQGLSLNASKISGFCGKLMCCLRYELEVYNEEQRLTPPNNSTVKTPDGIGTVIGSSPLAGTVKVRLRSDTEETVKQFHRDELTVLPKESGGEKAEKGKARNGERSGAAQKSAGERSAERKTERTEKAEVKKAEAPAEEPEKTAEAVSEE